MNIRTTNSVSFVGPEFLGEPAKNPVVPSWSDVNKV